MPAASTPHNRVLNLLKEALPLVDRSHPAFISLSKAHDVAAGLDPYLEQHSSPLIVPTSHAVPEKEVRAVWADLLAATDAEDWALRFKEGTTQFALNSGMVRVSPCPRRIRANLFTVQWQLRSLGAPDVGRHLSVD